MSLWPLDELIKWYKFQLRESTAELANNNTYDSDDDKEWRRIRCHYLG